MTGSSWLQAEPCCCAAANGQGQPDFSTVQIKTTPLGNGLYMLEGQGGNITVAVTGDAPLSDDTNRDAFTRLVHRSIKARS